MPIFGKPKPVQNPCPRCGKELIIWKLEGMKHGWCKNEDCRFTSTADSSLSEISKFMNLYVARVLRGNKVVHPRYPSRNIEKVDLSVVFPTEKRGEKVVDLYFDVSGMVKGDLVFVAERLGMIEYYKNLKLGTEHLPRTASWEYATKALEQGDVRRFFEIIQPYSQIARAASETVIQVWNRASVELQEPTVVPSTLGPVFEKAVAQLLTKMNVKGVVVTGSASDKGIDLEGYLDEQRIVIQCKYQHPLNPVKPTQVRDFAHVLEREGVRGYLITSSTFSPECYLKENCGEVMELIDRNRLFELAKSYRVPELNDLLR
jgi:ssDNA-binding Zn-finger/Zn-ribbon topoisomerase 1